MSEQQAVVNDSDAESQTSVEESSAQDDLDSILKEFEDTTPPAETAPQPVAQDNSDVIEWVRQEREAKMRETTQKDLQAATAVMKESVGELPIDVPDEVFEGLLYKRAESDPRIMKAWIKRQQNPEGWRKTLRALGKEVSQKFVKTDRKATDDWNAVDSAVHSASTSTRESGSAPNFNSMTDAEFQKWKMQNG